jgi:SAM-dependent methyltransferase
MGDVNQRIFLERGMPIVDGPVLEIGSRDYGNTVSFRDLYRNNQYTGVDLSDGPGVDVVWDLTQGIGPLAANSYALVICCSVLEHTPTPWRLADTITSLLRPNGAAYISVPWVWRYHAYPDDYYRFSYSALRHLFPELHWEQACYTTTVPGESFPITAEHPNIDSDLRLSKKLGENRHRTYMPYLMVNGLARKPVAH